jgi:hypothetical protein
MFKIREKRIAGQSLNQYDEGTLNTCVVLCLFTRTTEDPTKNSQKKWKN